MMFRDRIAATKPFVFAAALLPLAHIVWDTLHDALGTDPVAQLEHRTGDWALRLLLATLAMTPLRRLTGNAGFVRYRRMLGLFAFFYACLHLTTYLVVDLGGYWAQLLSDIAKRPYITVGFSAWLILLALAATSTRGMIRRLGRRWQQLHRFVYAAALLACLHYLWLVKADMREPVMYLGVFAALMSLRVVRSRLSAQGSGRRMANRESRIVPSR